jgi:hypothetical protein
MIPCPEDCDTELGVLCDIDKQFSDPIGFTVEGRCMCEAGNNKKKGNCFFRILCVGAQMKV